MINSLNIARMTVKDGIAMSETHTTSSKSPRQQFQAKRRKRDINRQTVAYNDVISMDLKL